MSCRALEEPQRQTERVSRSLLMATDFDGTIAPIVSNPADAIISPLAQSVLSRCSNTPGVVVAILSGRDVDDVRRRIGTLAAIVAGSHGLECEDADGRMLWTAPREIAEVPNELAGQIAEAGFFIERKHFSVAVHFRNRADDDGGRPLSSFAIWAKQQGLELIPGRRVLEARTPGSGKRAALSAIARHAGARRIVYTGDDTTDFPALALAAEHGRAIFVASPERNPPDIPSLWIAQSLADLCCFFMSEIDDQLRPHASQRESLHHD